MNNGKHLVLLSPSLDTRINAIVEESGLDRGEVLRQAFALYYLAYETARSGGNILLQMPVDGTYQLIEVTNIGNKAKR